MTWIAGRAEASSASRTPRFSPVVASVTTSSAGSLTRTRGGGATIASVSPSESTLRHSTVIRIIMPGKKVGHHAPEEMIALPSARMLPHDGDGGLIPALMKDNEASKTIASATSTAANTRTGARALRATCLTIIHHVGAPITQAAAT